MWDVVCGMWYVVVLILYLPRTANLAPQLFYRKPHRRICMYFCCVK